MTEKDRWQLWVGFIAVSLILGLAGLIVAVASLSRVAVLLALGFLTVVAVVIVGVSMQAGRRPGLLVPPSLRGLDPDSLRLVSRAVHSGDRADRPELATAVVSQARRKQTATALVLLSWACVVAVRVAALASGESGTASAIDTMVVVGSVLAAAAAVPSLLRARRAMSANTMSVNTMSANTMPANASDAG